MGRENQMGQDALNAAWRAPRDTEEKRTARGPSGAEREIELPTGDDEALELDTRRESDRHLASVGREIELPTDDGEEIALDTEEKRFAPGMTDVRPTRIRVNGPKKAA